MKENKKKGEKKKENPNMQVYEKRERKNDGNREI